MNSAVRAEEQEMAEAISRERLAELLNEELSREKTIIRANRLAFNDEHPVIDIAFNTAR